MAKLEIPKYNDPYVGEVFGNILDTYDNPTYNIKMYMLTKELTDGAVKSDMTTKNDELTGNPGEMIILAQTGVTGSYIDDLDLQSYFGSSGENPIEMNFKVKQPGAASFLDQIHMAKAYLGHEAGTNLQFFIEILFAGYTSDVEDNVEGGAPTQIAGPYRYALNMSSMSVVISDEGSEYDISAYIQKSFAYTPTVYTLPADFITKGTTVTEHIEHLAKQLNEWQKETTGNDVPDEYEFDLKKFIGGSSGGGSTSTAEEGEEVTPDDEQEQEETTPTDGTVGSSNLIEDDTMIKPTDSDVEDTNRMQNEEQANSEGDAVSDRKTQEENPKDEGEQSEAQPDTFNITHKEGQSITKVFETLLSMCPAYLNMISRKEDLSSQTDEDVDSGKAFVSWFKVNAEVSNIKFDKSRNNYAKKYVYKPKLIQSSRTDVAVSEKENSLDKDTASERIGQLKDAGAIKKAYHYFFTGLNDQIQQLDITYDNGIALLFPPKGGFIGDFATVEGQRLKDGLEEQEGADLEAQVDDQEEKNKEKDKKGLFSLLDDIKELVDDVQDIAGEALDALNKFSEITGVETERLKSVLQDVSGASARALVDEITTRDRAIANRSLSVQASTESAVPPDYDPEISDFQYSVDFTNPLDMDKSDRPITVEDLEKFGFLQITQEQMEKYLAVEPNVSRSQNTKHNVKSGSYKVGDPSNTLFGTLATQHSNDLAFLISIDMVVRGDPWYMGNYEDDKASEEYAAYDGVYENHFMLTMRSPQAFDPDFTDEDSDLNSGYWRYDGTSRTFSGLYRIVRVTNSFSGGDFRTNIEAQRIIGADVMDPDQEETQEQPQADANGE